ncbi:histone-lysine N-methyltransferase set-1-like isoform X1 [Montipora capricornis]|uniref:histone-lysine N-methyltransferase set-1-like isoform X1 n=1 Tax=Montipora capricornis TaxID=246305 RepID=UPI0035F1CB30
MPRKGKVKGHHTFTSEKSILDTIQRQISRQQESTSQPNSEANVNDGSSTEEDTSKHVISTAASGSAQQILDKSVSLDVEQRNFGGNEKGNVAESIPDEKVTAKSEKIPYKDDLSPMQHFNDKEITKSDMKNVKSKSANQSVSSGLLRWDNKQPAQIKGRKKKEKKREDKESRQTEVSEYFAVRRSSRKCKSAVEGEKQKELEEALLSGKEDGLEVKEVEGKGRGVFTLRNFDRGQFVCEYAGELVDYQIAMEREKFYEGKTEFGCYMYYFTFKNKKMCVDATKESGRLGRLLNHSKSAANCATRLVSVKDKPYLILETTRDVRAGEELLYDYGERSKDVIQFHQWLKS